MIKFEKFTLSNGLKLLVHEDHTTPLAAINIVYDVGARDESIDKTGFAHLFEHLMFGGSVNIPNYDGPLQRAGGENNAFTNNDITNYYITLPAQNLETGFWLESDRMLSLAFSEKSLEVQRNVVVEEFKERYLNQPYGDAWLLLRPLAYKVHPYQWATIGKETAHIDNATLEDVKAFFSKHYCPLNAILSVAGNIRTAEVVDLAEKWFGTLPAGNKYQRSLPVEPAQTEARRLTVKRDVPLDAIYLAFHCCARKDEQYYALEMLTDVLFSGHSSRFYIELVKKQQLFSELSGYCTGDFDKGLVVIEGKLVKGISPEQAEQAIMAELEKIKIQLIQPDELTKVKNKIESSYRFTELSVLNKAMNLAFSELLGDANDVNKELAYYHAVTAEEIAKQANEIFKIQNCSTLYYLAN